MAFNNYAMPQKKRTPINPWTPDSDVGQSTVHEMGHAAPMRQGMDWKTYLPGISQGFQRGGMIGAGVGALGTWLKSRKR